MGIENLFGLAQATSYFITFVLSFFICVPIGINVDHFDGHCLLSSTGSWERTGNAGVKLHISEWGPSSACNFSIFLSVISMIVSLFYFGWRSILLARNVRSTWLDSFVNLIVNSVMCICFFSTALTVSIGIQDWCRLLTRPESGIDSCEDAQFIQLDLPAFIHTDHFYTHWQLAQFGLWCSWIMWLILSVMSLVRQYKFHRQEAFLTSINRERQRLLQRVSQDPQNL